MGVPTKTAQNRWETTPGIDFLQFSTVGSPSPVAWIDSNGNFSGMAQVVLYADDFPGIDMGAKINAAYAAAPAAPSCTVIVVPNGTFDFTTQILFNTLDKAVILQGQGASITGGTILNYTPTTATAAITIDWSNPDGGGFAPGTGLRDLTLSNGNLTVGGSGSSATGISIGPVNSGAPFAEFSNVRIEGFGIGIDVPDVGTQSWGMVFRNVVLCYNNTGVSFQKTEEQITFVACKILLNGVGVNYDTGSSGDATYLGGSIDSNTIMGVEFNHSTTIFTAVGTHWENLGVSGDVHYVHGTAATLNIEGGIALNDNTTGTSGSWFYNAFFNVQGLVLYSGGATQSDYVFSVQVAGNISVFVSNAAVISVSRIAFTGAGTILEIVTPETVSAYTVGNLVLIGATPTTGSGQAGLGVTSGFGNGSSGTSMTTTTKGTGSGPSSPDVVVQYLEIDIAGTKYWIPLVR